MLWPWMGLPIDRVELKVLVVRTCQSTDLSHFRVSQKRMPVPVATRL